MTHNYQYAEVRKLQAQNKAKKQLLHFDIIFFIFTICKNWTLILNLYYEVQPINAYYGHLLHSCIVIYGLFVHTVDCKHAKLQLHIAFTSPVLKLGHLQSTCEALTDGITKSLMLYVIKSRLLRSFVFIQGIWKRMCINRNKAMLGQNVSAVVFEVKTLKSASEHKVKPS